MNERTIGGKPAKEAFDLLLKDIPGVLKKTKEQGQPYLEVEVLRRFFDGIIPIQNYDFEISQLQHVTSGSSACFVCVGTLTVFDDNGEKITSKSYVGSNECQKKKDGSGYVDFAMSAKNAAVNARKNCIEMFGCGRNQLSIAKADAKAGKSRQRPEAGRNGGGGHESALGREVNNTSISRCASPVPEEGNRNASRMEHPPYKIGNFQLACHAADKIKDLPKMFLIPVKMLEYGGFETRLLIWKSNVKNADELTGWISTGKAFVCAGKYEPYGGSHRIVLMQMGGHAG